MFIFLKCSKVAIVSNETHKNGILKDVAYSGNEGVIDSRSGLLVSARKCTPVRWEFLSFAEVAVHGKG